MATKLSNAEQQTLLLVLGVLSDLGLSETRRRQKAALAYCTTSLLEIVAPPNAPATAVTQAAPPAATVTAISEPDPPPTPAQARRSAGAVKANATRKANKAKSAGTAEKIGADTKAPAKSDDPAVTE